MKKLFPLLLLLLLLTNCGIDEDFSTNICQNDVFVNNITATIVKKQENYTLGKREIVYVPVEEGERIRSDSVIISVNFFGDISYSCPGTYLFRFSKDITKIKVVGYYYFPSNVLKYDITKSFIVSCEINPTPYYPNAVEKLNVILQDSLMEKINFLYSMIMRFHTFPTNAPLLQAYEVHLISKNDTFVARTQKALVIP